MPPSKFDPADLKGAPPPIHGRFYVFVDECHRPQGGGMNEQMKRWLAGAIFIGFTGTPLLRKDKQVTRDIFGTYIHTYKFHQAVEDKVVLDLKYGARDVPQRISTPAKIDEWFEGKTRGLNNYQRAVVRRRWATLEALMSASDRKGRIIASIIMDFSSKPRLDGGRGTAILVAASIYDACHYYQLFQNTPFGKHCGIITSHEPNHNAISREPKDSDERFKFNIYTDLVLKAGQTTKAYEDEAKRRFIKEPANTKLLIVVSKLLTGFDAPSCSYVYLENELRDHNLFQAICRTNRLDGDDKDYGYIVNFKKLFGKVEEAVAVYAISKLNWIREQRGKLEEQARETPRQFVGRETHYLWGRRYLLTVLQRDVKPHVSLDHRRIRLTVRPDSDASRRAQVIHEWHKSLLHQVVPSLIRKWETKLKVTVSGYFLQRMRTKWGSCNPTDRHIRLNTELVKKLRDLLEYVVVHEMAHLIEPTHNDRFIAILEELYPGWREARAELNYLPLSAEAWTK